MSRLVLLVLVGCGGGLSAPDGSVDDGSMTTDATVVTDVPTQPDVGADGGIMNPCMNGYCASSMGECLKISEETCGNFGDQCERCDVDAGYFCKGACFRKQPNCNTSNCAGCCASTDYCSTGVHDIACGHDGLPCDRCVPSEGTGQCVLRDGGGGNCSTDPGCAPNNCKGCCVGNVCAVGTQNIACGTGGVACANCNFVGEKCIGSQCQK